MERAKRSLGLGLATLGLVVGCNGKATVTSDDINGFTASGVDQAFFGFAEGFGADFDGDENFDAVAVLVIAISDNKDLCKTFKNLSAFDSATPFGSSSLLFISAFAFASNSDGPALVDGLAIRNEERNAIDVDFTVFEEQDEGGVDVVLQVGDNDDGLLAINNASATDLSGDITVSMGFTDAAGVPQTANISGTFSAARCSALDSVALAGDTFF
jgi:hypothetical protein